MGAGHKWGLLGGGWRAAARWQAVVTGRGLGLGHQPADSAGSRAGCCFLVKAASHCPGLTLAVCAGTPRLAPKLTGALPDVNNAAAAWEQRRALHPATAGAAAAAPAPELLPLAQLRRDGRLFTESQEAVPACVRPSQPLRLPLLLGRLELPLATLDEQELKAVQVRVGGTPRSHVCQLLCIAMLDAPNSGLWSAATHCPPKVLAPACRRRAQASTQLAECCAGEQALVRAGVGRQEQAVPQLRGKLLHALLLPVPACCALLCSAVARCWHGRDCRERRSVHPSAAIIAPQPPCSDTPPMAATLPPLAAAGPQSSVPLYLGRNGAAACPAPLRVCRVGVQRCAAGGPRPAVPVRRR